MRIVVGSSSRWRQQIAKTQLGIDVELMPPDIDEKQVAHKFQPKTPQEHTQVISNAKLDFLLSKLESDTSRGENPVIVICCDTVVYYNNNILEKPIDKNECLETIKSWGIKNARIGVYTAISVGAISGSQNSIQKVTLSEVHKSDVVMIRDLTNDDITFYFNNSNCIDSSGSLIVETLMEMKAAIIDGDQTVIEGLPVAPCKRMIQELESKLGNK